jgi:hypothetical protein
MYAEMLPHCQRNPAAFDLPPDVFVGQLEARRRWQTVALPTALIPP